MKNKDGKLLNKQIKQSLKILIKIFALLISITVIMQISFLRVNLGNFYYAIIAVGLILLLISERKIRLNYISLFFVFAGLVSILLNDIPDFFRPYQRFMAFIIVIGLVGPLVENDSIRIFRKKLFKLLNWIMFILIVLSFIGISLGLPGMVSRSGYSGFFNHSMMLGPIASIVMLTSINKAYEKNKSTIRWLYIIVSAMAFITCVAAGSRSALLAGIGGGVFYYYKINQGRISRFITIILFISAIGILSYPLWDSYTEKIVNKMAYAEQQGNALASRAFLWGMRLEEFRSSPIIGVGFASVDPKISTHFDDSNGTIEPGSSWLAILSMIGLFGFIPFVILIVTYIRYLLREVNNKLHIAFLGSLLFTFLIHMLAEGYILSAGSGLFFYFWLIMGNIQATKEQHFLQSI